MCLLRRTMLGLEAARTFKSTLGGGGLTLIKCFYGLKTSFIRGKTQSVHLKLYSGAGSASGISPMESQLHFGRWL